MLNSISKNQLLNKLDRGPAVSLLFGVIAIGTGLAISLLVVNVSNTLVLGVIVAGLLAVLYTFKKVEFGLLVLLFISFSRASDVVIKTHGAPSLMKPLMVLLILLIVFRWFWYNEKPEGWERPALIIMGYGLIGFASLLYAANTEIVQDALIDFFKDAIIAVVIAILLMRAKSLRRAVWAMLAAGILMGTLSTYQQLTGTFENDYWGFSQAEVSHIVGREDDYRIGGPGFHPNAYAQILLLLIPLALDRLWNEEKLVLRLLAGWALAVCALSIFFTFSRGGFIGLIGVIAIMLIYRPPKPLILMITILIAAFLLQYMPAQYQERMLTLVDLVSDAEQEAKTESSFRGRLSENISAWMMFLDHPVLGVGLHNYQDHYQSYSRQLGLDSRREERTPHNFYLEIASEMGFLGLGWLCVVIWTTFKGLGQARRDFKEAGLSQYDGLVVAIGVSLVGFLITSIYIHLAYPRYFWMLFGLALAVPHVARQELRKQTWLKDNPNPGFYSRSVREKPNSFLVGRNEHAHH
jgi:O-antigen ligase